jgi:membrane protease YdiL (CAAX protease family)
MLGAGWELLYRGFLLLVLTPSIGAWGAVAVSGLSYGAAHGYKNPKQFSLASTPRWPSPALTC